ncbi:DUF2510 domain-containing protein [Microbacterium sp. NPDC058345]|uniref:DUF2510 domain-containing protein n=1 Tax=Microbacterium sp. NPDC058345 TaxID=3346455 RepID=UPI00364EF0B6
MSVPAGWYDDGSGRQRWWDGQQWTEHFAPAQGESATEATTGESDAAASAEELDDLDATVRREDVPQRDADASFDAAAEPIEPVEPVEPVEPSAPAAYTAPDALGQPVADHAAPTAYETSAYAPPAAPGYAAPAAPAYGDPNATAAYPAGSYPGGGPYPGAYPGGAQPYGGSSYGVEQPGPAKPPILGFIGLGLAVVGTILACIPPVLTGFGFFLLFAAFVVSLIAIFMKTKKWPAIAGLALSVVGAIVGGIVVVVYFVNFANTIADEFPTDFPSSFTSEEPTDEEPGDATGRPSPEEIAAGFLVVLHDAEVTEFDDPEVSSCIGQYFYDSDLSDETLRTIAGGEDVYGADTQEVQSVTTEAIVECTAE